MTQFNPELIERVARAIAPRFTLNWSVDEIRTVALVAIFAAFEPQPIETVGDRALVLWNLPPAAPAWRIAHKDRNTGLWWWGWLARCEPQPTHGIPLPPIVQGEK